jgi:hypothetical protein
MDPHRIDEIIDRLNDADEIFGEFDSESKHHYVTDVKYLTDCLCEITGAVKNVLEQFNDDDLSRSDMWALQAEKELCDACG